MSLHNAARNGDLTAAESALSSPNGRACMNKLDKHGRTPLHWAARNGHERIVDLLIRNGADVNIQTKSQKYTALIMAVEFGREAIVKKLVENKANVNLAADGNNMALHKAALSEDSRLVQILLEHGAHPTPVDSTGRTPLGHAVSEENAVLLMGFGGRLAVGETQDLPRRLLRELDLQDLQDLRVRIHWAVRAAGNPIPIVKKLLAEDPQLITSRNARGWHLLHSAAFVGNRNLVQLLLNADSGSINCLTRGRWTPLLLAAEKGHNDVLQLLAEKRADATIIPTERNKQHSAVWYATNAKACTVKTVEMLKNLELSQKGDGNLLSSQDVEDDACTPDPNSTSPSEVGSFDGYLCSTSRTTDPLSEHYFADLEKTFQNHFQFHEDDKIIKVAVLDTGINLSHPDFQMPRATGFINGTPKRAEKERPQITRINSRGRKNFATRRLGADDVNDLDGHGTKVAGLILRLAPRAELYIARVCDGVVSSEASGNEKYQKGPHAKNVAAAVEWAIDQKVDIINMSFGFDNAEVGVLRPVLENANNSGILVFAAMSNGPLKKATWPAKQDHYAIGIHSFNVTERKPSGFTALFVEDNKNLMVPGEGVITHKLRDFDFETVDGTSFATPVATAMAALILAYVNQKRCETERKDAQKLIELTHISRARWMIKLLGCLSYQKQLSDTKYTLIRPTLFWDTSSQTASYQKDKWIAWTIIERILSN